MHPSLGLIPLQHSPFSSRRGTFTRLPPIRAYLFVDDRAHLSTVIHKGVFNKFRYGHRELYTHYLLVLDRYQNISSYFSGDQLFFMLLAAVNVLACRL